MFKKIKWFFQRGMRGYSDYDLWDLHSYLAEFLVEALTDMKRKYVNNGIYPFEVDDEYEWLKLLDEMIRGFQAIKEIDETDDLEKIEKLAKIAEKGLKTFSTYFRDLWI